MRGYLYSASRFPQPDYRRQNHAAEQVAADNVAGPVDAQVNPGNAYQQHQQGQPAAQPVPQPRVTHPLPHQVNQHPAQQNGKGGVAAGKAQAVRDGVNDGVLRAGTAHQRFKRRGQAG